MEKAGRVLAKHWEEDTTRDSTAVMGTLNPGGTGPGTRVPLARGWEAVNTQEHMQDGAWWVAHSRGAGQGIRAVPTRCEGKQGR